LKKSLFVTGLSGLVEQHIKDDRMAILGKTDAVLDDCNTLMVEREGQALRQEMLARGSAYSVCGRDAIVLESSP
jgi:hypothetical protein